jgi:hypothetical protein
MLVLKKRHGSKFWTARGTYCGIKVDRSLRTGDRGEAQLLLAKIQKQIYDEQTGQSGGDSFGPTFAEAVINYVQKGGERRFLEPLLKYFGDLPIKKVDQAAIDQAVISLSESRACRAEPGSLWTNLRNFEIKWRDSSGKAIENS